MERANLKSPKILKHIIRSVLGFLNQPLGIQGAGGFFNYFELEYKWCRECDSNTRPTHYECVALPTELSRHRGYFTLFIFKNQALFNRDESKKGEENLLQFFFFICKIKKQEFL